MCINYAINMLNLIHFFFRLKFTQAKFVAGKMGNNYSLIKYKLIFLNRWIILIAHANSRRK